MKAIGSEFRAEQSAGDNVEMVLATAPAGADRVEQGMWTASVTIHRLVWTSQSFSQVLTPDCPVIIDRDLTLSGDIRCSASTIDAIGVKIISPNVELDCANHLVESVALVEGSRGIVSAASRDVLHHWSDGSRNLRWSVSGAHEDQSWWRQTSGE